MDLKHLQLTQDEMIRKLSAVDDETVGVGGDHSESSSASATPKVLKKFDSGKDGSKRHRWKNWGKNWKHSPAKSSSIEEEPTAPIESPKRANSSKSSTPNQSPKHKANSNETIASGGDDALTPFRRRKQQSKSETPKAELRASAGARLIQMFDNNGLEKFGTDCEEFNGLLAENGRPASIHILQTHHDEF